MPIIELQPEIKRPTITEKIDFPADLHDRLKVCASQLKDPGDTSHPGSSIPHTITQMVRAVLDAQESANKPASQRGRKNTPRKASAAGAK